MRRMLAVEWVTTMQHHELEQARLTNRAVVRVTARAWAQQARD